MANCSLQSLFIETSQYGRKPMIPGPLIGGVAGATATLLYAWLKEWWSRPRLTIDAEQEGALASSADGSVRYARVFVKNIGRCEAKDVQVLLVERNNIKTEVLDMEWSHLGPVKISLPRGVGRYLDVCRARPFTKEDARLDLSISNFQQQLGQGRWSLVVIAVSANAKPARACITVSMERQMNSLRIISRTLL